MMKKVEIVAPGDTRFIYGQQIDKFRFHEENRRVMAEGGQVADIIVAIASLDPVMGGVDR